MITLTECPGCGGARRMELDLPTDLSEIRDLPASAALIIDSRFALCAECGLIYARCRQGEEDSAGYYDLFARLEQREYAVYPPPQEFIESQSRFAEELIGALEGSGLIRPGMSVLNVRSECGSHLALLRDRHGLTDLYGLDHFESNIRYARERLGMPHVEALAPGRLEIPFPPRTYDLVLANHQVTHAFRPRALLMQLAGLLAPGGGLVLYNEIDHARYFEDPRSYREGVNNFHKQLLTRASLVRLCRAAGLDPRLVLFHPVGRKWAYTACSMVVEARLSGAVPGGETADGDPAELLATLAAWGRRFRSRRRRRRIKAALRRLNPF